jgi:hypothetical protein
VYSEWRYICQENLKNKYLSNSYHSVFINRVSYCLEPTLPTIICCKKNLNPFSHPLGNQNFLLSGAKKEKYLIYFFGTSPSCVFSFTQGTARNFPTFQEKANQQVKFSFSITIFQWQLYYTVLRSRSRKDGSGSKRDVQHG